MMLRQRLQQMSLFSPETNYEPQTFKAAVIRPLLKKKSPRPDKFANEMLIRNLPLISEKSSFQE